MAKREKVLREDYAYLNKEEARANERAFHRLRQMHNSFYDAIDPRRRVEYAEGGMVAEDHKAMANLSETPIHREYTKYPRTAYYENPYFIAIKPANDGME
jgi:hypothetical protein